MEALTDAKEELELLVKTLQVPIRRTTRLESNFFAKKRLAKENGLTLKQELEMDHKDKTKNM